MSKPGWWKHVYLDPTWGLTPTGPSAVGLSSSGHQGGVGTLPAQRTGPCWHWLCLGQTPFPTKQIFSDPTL